MARMQTVETGRPFWLPYVQPNDAVGVGLTGNAGETKQASTPQPDEDLRLLGGISDLSTSQVQISDGGGGRRFSAAMLPIGYVFGKRATARPVLYYQAPPILRASDFLSATVLNVGPEGAATNPGNLIHVCEPANESRQVLQIDTERAYPFWLDVSAGLAGTANEYKEVDSGRDTQNDLIVWGAATDLGATAPGVHVRVWGVRGEPLTGDFVPVWAVAGYTSGQLNVFSWPRPYHVPAGGRIRFGFRNPAANMESNGHVYLLTSKIPRG